MTSAPTTSSDASFRSRPRYANAIQAWRRCSSSRRPMLATGRCARGVTASFAKFPGVTIGRTAGTIATSHWLTHAGGEHWRKPDGSIRRHDALHRALHELLPDLPRHSAEPFPRDRKQARRAQAFPPDDGVRRNVPDGAAFYADQYAATPAYMRR